MSERPVVMISSTARDLPQHRKEVMDGCLGQGVLPRMMEHLPARDADAIAASLELVDGAQLYIGIIAHRYKVRFSRMSLFILACVLGAEPVEGEMLFSRPYTSRLHSMDVSPTGLVALGADPLVYVYDPSKKTDVTLEGHANVVSGAAFSPDGKILVTVGYDKDIKMWDTKEWKVLRERAHTKVDGFTCVTYSPDGLAVATGCANGDVVLWDVRTGGEIRSFSHGKRVTAITYSPKGDLIISGGTDNSIVVWEAATGKRRLVFDKQKGFLRSLVMLDSRILLSGSREDRTFMVWDLENGKETKLPYRIPTYAGPILGLSPSRKLLAVGGDQNIGFFVDLVGKKYMSGFEAEEAGGFKALRFSPQEDVVYTLTLRRLLAWKVK